MDTTLLCSANKFFFVNLSLILTKTRNKLKNLKYEHNPNEPKLKKTKQPKTNKIARPF